MRYWLPLVLPQAGQHRSSESTENIFEGVPAMTGEGRAPVEVLKVSATSKPVAVAGAIAGVIRSKGRVEVQAIGAGAFIDISIDGEERTGIRLLVESR